MAAFGTKKMNISLHFSLIQSPNPSFLSKTCGPRCFELSLNWKDSTPIIINTKVKIMSSTPQLRMIDEYDQRRDLFELLLAQEFENQSMPLPDQPSPDSFEMASVTLPMMIKSIDTSQGNDQAHQKEAVSCTCPRSMCRQKYCPCFKQGSRCNQSCVCIGCLNEQFVPRRISYVLGSIDQLARVPHTF